MNWLPPVDLHVPIYRVHTIWTHLPAANEGLCTSVALQNGADSLMPLILLEATSVPLRARRTYIPLIATNKIGAYD
eukprot:scaffold99163_cov41-Prasinocladus_malaysianus.AAC.3